MAQIILHSDRHHASTSVPNTFIDEYMSGANGEFVKIYLYLLRLMENQDAAFSISSIADRFEHTEKDVKRALSYWEKMHLLRLEYDSNQNLVGVYLLNSVLNESEKSDPHAAICETSVTAPAVSAPVVTAPAAAPVTEPPHYSASDIREFRKNETVAELFFIAERYLGRTLSSTDINTLLYLYDGLNFSPDLLEYLIESCVSAGHTSIQYIQKVGLNWHKADIRTVEEARNNSQFYNKTYAAVMKAFGINGRNLVPTETGYIDKWTNTYGFSTELIEEALKRTIHATHQPSFPYADSMLDNWRKHNVRSLEDVAKLDSEHELTRKKIAAANTVANANPATNAGSSRNKFNNFKQRSYDYDQLEKMLLNTSAN
jgi:DnaD/phage-associated family protein